MIKVEDLFTANIFTIFLNKIPLEQSGIILDLFLLHKENFII